MSRVYLFGHCNKIMAGNRDHAVLLTKEMLKWPVIIRGNLMNVPSNRRLDLIAKSVLEALMDLGDFDSEITWKADLEKKQIIATIGIFCCQGAIFLEDRVVLDLTRSSEGHGCEFVHHWVNSLTEELVPWRKKEWKEFFVKKIIESTQSSFKKAKTDVRRAKEALTSTKKLSENASIAVQKLL